MRKRSCFQNIVHVLHGHRQHSALAAQQDAKRLERGGNSSVLWQGDLIVLLQPVKKGPRNVLNAG